MSSMDTFFNSLSSFSSVDPRLIDTAIGMLAAFVFGQVLAWAYERTYRGLSYSNNVTQTLILSCMSAALLIEAMKYSMIAGLGLLAALSMIRFRTTLKSPKDLVYIMAAVTLGVACGAHALMPATVGTIAFTMVTLYLHTGVMGSRTQYDGVLRFRVPSDVVMEPDLSVLLKSCCRRTVLLSIGEVSQGQFVEHAYQVKLRGERMRTALLDGLREKCKAGDARLLMQDATLEY